MDVTSPLAAGGLILDVAGAIALASAFAFKQPKDMSEEAQSLYGGAANPHLMISFAKQKADAQVGGLLLILGFLGQLASSVGASDVGSLRLLLPLSLALAGGAFLFLWWLRRWQVRRMFGCLLSSLHDPSHWLPIIRSYGNALGRTLRENERPADLAIWMIGPKRWRRVSERADVPDDVMQPYRSPER